jgi:hypothetical protein
MGPDCNADYNQVVAKVMESLAKAKKQHRILM